MPVAIKKAIFKLLVFKMLQGNQKIGVFLLGLNKANFAVAGKNFYINPWRQINFIELYLR